MNKKATISILPTLILFGLLSGCTQKRTGNTEAHKLDGGEDVAVKEAYQTIDKDLDSLNGQLKTAERVLGKPLDRRIYDTLYRAKQAVRNKDAEESTKLYWQTIELARDHLVDSSTIEAFKSALDNIGKRLDDDGPCKEAFRDLLALRTRNKLREIVIPEFTIGPPATLIDALDFFKMASRDYDDPKIPIDRRGVSLVLKLAQKDAGTHAESRDEDPNSETAHCDAPVIPHISARFITLYDAIRLVCEATGCKMDTREGFVMISPKDDNDASMRVKGSRDWTLDK